MNSMKMGMGAVALVLVAGMVCAATPNRGEKEVNLGTIAIPANGDAVASVSAYVLEQKIADETDPEFQPLVRLVAEFSFPDKDGGFLLSKTALNKAQGGVVFLKEELDRMDKSKAPAAWLEGLKKPLAWSFVYQNVRSDRGIGARVAGVLQGGSATVVEPNTDAIKSALETIWPGLSKAAPEVRKAVWDEIDGLNPGLSAAGWQRVLPGMAAEPWPHLDLPVAGHTLRYRWQPMGGSILIPCRAHLEKISAGIKPLAPEFVTYSAPKRWTATLDCPAALPGSPARDLRLFIAGEGDEVVSAAGILPNEQNAIILVNAVDQGAADPKLLPAQGGYYDQPDWPKTLKRSGDALKGGLRIVISDRQRYVLVLDASLAGNQVSGTFSTRECPAAIAPSPESVASGKVLLSGSLVWVKDFPTGQPLPKDGTWMTFQGNTGSGSDGIVTRPSMIEDAKQAKLAWLSHDLLPHGEGADMRSTRWPGETVIGGFGSPAVAGGRVFMAYYRPAGTKMGQFFVDRDTKVGGALFPALIQADDVVQGFDAATGATAWKTVFPLKGSNRGTMHKSGFQGSPCAQGDAVYVMGNLLKLYCLDAATGVPRWESDFGPGHQRIQRAFDEAMKAGVHIGGTGKSDASEWTNRGLQGNPRLIGGVLVMHDGQRWNAGCIGVDPATGKRLWHVSAVGSTVVPLVWQKDGREYIVAIGGGGFTAALDPKDGRVLWRCVNFDSGYIGASTVCGDILVGFDGAGKRRAGFRMTLAGCSKIWELTDEQTGGGASPATAHKGRIYCFSKDSQSLQVVEPETGNILATAEHPAGAIIEHGSLVVGAGDRLFSDNGRELQGLFVWDVGPVKPRYLGLLPAPRSAGYAVAIDPAIVDGRLFMRLNDRLAGFDLRKGLTDKTP